MTTIFDETYWNERYGNSGKIWSGNPNPQLVAEAAALDSGSVQAPKKALDVGCGEGADSVWLAGQGWQVTGVDISTVALQRAAAHAAELELPGSVAWEHHDLLGWTPPAASFDLISAQFMHLPRPDRDKLFARLAAAVVPGGTLLIVGHAPSDSAAGAHRALGADMFFTAKQIAEALDPSQWDVVVAASRPRSASGPDGETITIHDEVMRAVRLK
ncbi:class I SAM-dependent methyltransferase [Arthrobacter glacialis]|uniref:class I SAM-dependent methyltransferase n=1 Tax=Arthrobacter glacialis TaxID=1664 RepID=UPI000CD44382|nr:class I SAM-dependent methyltransferase [Arthrobacter glacialis]POH59887.1 SAM-dependent methyltransferase [Arthrobacter glacialis]